MTLTRRSVFAGMVAAIAAPAIIRTPGLIMPIKAGHLVPRGLVYEVSWLASTPYEVGAVVEIASHHLREKGVLYRCMSFSQPFRRIDLAGEPWQGALQGQALL